MKHIRIINPDVQTLDEITTLVSKVTTKNWKPAVYIGYITANLPFDTLALFGAVDDSGSLRGIIQMEIPHPLSPEMGYMQMCASHSDVPIEDGLAVLELAEEWLKSKGATKWRCWTTVNPKLLMRKYKFSYCGKIDDEYVLGRDIQV